MSKKEKLLEKLKLETIKADELRTLLSYEGWIKRRQRGSHELWQKNGVNFVLATHSNNLKLYLIKEAKKILSGEIS